MVPDRCLVQYSTSSFLQSRIDFNRDQHGKAWLLYVNDGVNIPRYRYWLPHRTCHDTVLERVGLSTVGYLVRWNLRCPLCRRYGPLSETNGNPSPEFRLVMGQVGKVLVSSSRSASSSSHLPHIKTFTGLRPYLRLYHSAQEHNLFS